MLRGPLVSFHFPFGTVLWQFSGRYSSVRTQSSMTIQWFNNHSNRSENRIAAFYYRLLLLLLLLLLVMPISFLYYIQTLLPQHSRAASLTDPFAPVLVIYQQRFSRNTLLLFYVYGWSCFFRSCYTNVFIHPLFIALSLL